MKRLFFLSLILSFVSFGTVQAAVTCPDMTNWAIVGGVCVPTTAGTGLSSATVSATLVTFMLWLLGILNILGILAFVISGIQYLTAAGDEDQARTAKRNMTYAVVGVAIALSSYMIITAIDRIFAGNASF